jgi:hypothetical protein
MLSWGHACVGKEQRVQGEGVRRAGGGAVEAALSIFLENYATTLGCREQLAIAEAADALLVIPKTLAVNAAKDATELARAPLPAVPTLCSGLPCTSCMLRRQHSLCETVLGLPPDCVLLAIILQSPDLASVPSSAWHCQCLLLLSLRRSRAA